MATTHTQRGSWALATCLLAIAFVWLVVLPSLARHPRVRQRVEHLQKHGIEPAAMFYTDLPNMSVWESHIRSAQTRQQSDDGGQPTSSGCSHRLTSSTALLP